MFMDEKGLMKDNTTVSIIFVLLLPVCQSTSQMLHKVMSMNPLDNLMALVLLSSPFYL